VPPWRCGPLSQPAVKIGSGLVGISRVTQGLARHFRKRMAIVFIEPRPKGRPEGSPIDDYVVEDHDHVLGTFKTKEEAIAWANTKFIRPT
jgi:hypothetical protein